MPVVATTPRTGLTTALAVAGQSEVRKYQAFGVLADEQIGQPSDIVSVTFAGLTKQGLLK
jgi:hypothetical protein